MAETDPGVFLRDFYRALEDRPLDPAEDRYVPLAEDPSLVPTDPIAELQTTIEWSTLESTQLFSGFRGTGKTTQLRRLKRQLVKNGALVVLCDMEDYLNLTTPVDISDFLLAMAGAFGEALGDDETLLGKDPIREGYWTRFANFMSRTRVEFTEMGLSGEPGGVGAELKANLKADPSFRQVLQDRMKGHIGALRNDVHAFLQECVKALKARHGDRPVVLILDSVEKIRGTSVNAGEVAASLVELFQGHADKLKVQNLHLVYTVPPWLKIKAPGVATLYTGCQQIPCVRVLGRDDRRYQAGLDALEKVVRHRGDWARLLGSRAALDELLVASGGYLRDLFRLLQAVLRLSRNHGLPAGEHVRRLAVHELRNSYLPLSHEDARWLARIDRTKATEFEGDEDLPDLSRFFDNHLVLTYRNGDEWWGVHPVVVEQVRAQAKANPGPNGSTAG